MSYGLGSDNERASKNWAAKRFAFLKDKHCEWCGSTSNLAVVARVPLPPYSVHISYATAALLRAKVDEGEFSVIEREAQTCPNCGHGSISKRKSKKPACRCLNCRTEFDSPVKRLVSTGRLSRDDWERFWSKYGSEVKHRVEEERRMSERAHLELKDCIVLCRRCHFARLKGLELCPKCGEKYKRKGNEMCWQCYVKTDEGKEMAKRYEKVTYKHPWCGREFSIERQFWDLAANPQVCCVEICDMTMEHCGKAKEKWGSEADESAKTGESHDA